VSSAINNLTLLQLQDLSVIKTLGVAADEISISDDSKYILVAVDKSLQVFSAGSGILVKNLNYTTSLHSIAKSASGRFYVGMAGTNKIFTYSTESIELIRDTSDPNFEVIKFREEQKQFIETDERKRQRDFLLAFTDSVHRFVDELRDTLGAEYQFGNWRPNYDYTNNSHRVHNFIQRTDNYTRKIPAFYVLKFNGNEVIAGITPSEYGGGTEENDLKFRVFYTNPNWKEIKRLVRSYFKERLSWLKY